MADTDTDTDNADDFPLNGPDLFREAQQQVARLPTPNLAPRRTPNLDALAFGNADLEDDS